MKNENRYLEQRNSWYHYHRRVPVSFRPYDQRKLIRRTLKTQSIDVARERRDALDVADNDYWAARVTLDVDALLGETDQRLREAVELRYKAACLQAVTIGLRKAPIESLLRDLALGKLLNNIELVAKQNGAGVVSTEAIPGRALYGEASRPSARLSDAFEFYCAEIAVAQLSQKSIEQKRLWRTSKERSIRNFISVVGDKMIGTVSRDDAQVFYKWWTRRLTPKIGGKALSPKTANRDFSTLHKLYADYFTYFGNEDRPNPFRNLRFKNQPSREIPCFEDQWVREKLLRPGALKRLNKQARHILFTLIETGCRMSEVSNLTASDIRLDAEVPHISIRNRRGREIKTPPSKRDIPLVGVALPAIQHFPNGFPQYKDRGNVLSQTLLKFLREHELMPTDRHEIRSLRHSFEKRMLEAELDYGLRCTLMGHANTRPR